MLFKYTSRLIKSTLNRFIAILAIVFIGVSFMMGLRSNYNIMKRSVEIYNDTADLYDVQIYSNFGFDENDIKAVKNLDCVKEVYASKTRDVYSKDDSGIVGVTRVSELESNLNKIELIEGRMPQKDNECIIISGYSQGDYGIGNTLSLYLEDEELSDTLKVDKYEIVGLAKSGEHMSLTYSTSLLANKTLTNIIYVKNDNFVSDYYVTLFLSLNDAKDLDSFSDEYKDLVDEDTVVIENFASTQSQNLKNKILDDANKELQDAKDELEENRVKYQKELDDGKKKLDDAKQKIIDGEKELADAKRQIEEGEIEIPKNLQKLKDGQAEVENGYATLRSKEAELASGIKQLEQYGMSVDELQGFANDIESRYDAAIAQSNELKAQKKELDENRDKAREVVKESDYRNSLEVRTALRFVDPNTDPELYEKLSKEYDAFKTIESYDVLNFEIQSRQAIIDTTTQTLDTTISSVLGMGIKEGCAFINDSVKQIKDGQKQIADGYKQLEVAQKEIDNGYIQIEDAKKQLEQGKVDYQKGVEELEQGKIDYQNGLVEYEDGLKEFEKEMQDANDKIEDAEAQLADLQEAKWMVLKRYETNYSYYMYTNTCEQMKSIGTVIPLLFFVVGALVCATTMTRLIDEQRSQIGIYRAIGFRKSEIRIIYLLYVIIASLAASAVAVFVGLFIFPTIIYTTWRLMYDLPPISIYVPIDNLVLCTLVFTVLMSAVTYIVVNKSLKECSAQLLRPKAPKSTKKILLEKFTWLWSKLAFQTKVTARNIFRYKARFIMTVVGIAGCTSLLVMGWGIKDSISSVVRLQYEEVYKYNYIVDLKNDRHIDQMLESISLDKDNETYVAFSKYDGNVTLNDYVEAVEIDVINSTQAKDVINFEDYRSGKILDLNKDGVFITQKLAQKNNINVGDYITIESKEGETRDVKVSGVVVNYIMNFIYISEEQYQNLFSDEIEYTSIAVRNVGNPANLKNLANEFKDINSVGDFENAAQTFGDMINAMNLIIIIIILVAGALAFVVLINLTNVNISERIREIATLKVLGFREGEVNSYISKEVLLMSVVGAIIGLPIGNIEERYIMTVIDMDMCTFPHIIFPISYVYAFVLTIVFTIIVLILIRKTLRNVEMVESLKSIE